MTGDTPSHAVAQGATFSTGGQAGKASGEQGTGREGEGTTYISFQAHVLLVYRIVSYPGNRGITAQDMEKLQHTDFNQDTSFESASVTCSNIYRCDSWTLRKNEETRLDAFEIKGRCRLICHEMKTRVFFGKNKNSPDSVRI